MDNENYNSSFNIDEQLYFHDEEDTTSEGLQDNDDKQHVDETLGKFFVGCSISFRTAESSLFRDFCKALQNYKGDYRPPCRQTLAGPILKRIHQKVKEEKKFDLDDTEGVLMHDAWKNKVTGQELSVCTVKTKNTNQTFLYAEDASKDSKEGVSIARVMQEAIRIAKEEYNCYIYASLTDNASNEKLAAKLVTTYDGKPLWKVTCSSHSADLMFEKFKNNSEGFFAQVQSVITEFRNSKLAARLKELGGCKMINYPDTRWCYLRDSLVMVVKNKRYLRELCLDPFLVVKADVKKLVMDDEFFIEARSYVMLFAPICKFINKCQDPNCTIADCTQDWQQMEILDGDEEYVEILNERRKKAMSPVGFAANLLHPKYRGFALDDEQRKAAEKFLEENLDESGFNELKIYKSDFGRYSFSRKYYKSCCLLENYGITIQEVSTRCIEIDEDTGINRFTRIFFFQVDMCPQ